jgi:hypothetical protein
LNIRQQSCSKRRFKVKQKCPAREGAQRSLETKPSNRQAQVLRLFQPLNKGAIDCSEQLDRNKAACAKKAYPVTNSNEKLSICFHKRTVSTVLSERVVTFGATQKLG